MILLRLHRIANDLAKTWKLITQQEKQLNLQLKKLRHLAYEFTKAEHELRLNEESSRIDSEQIDKLRQSHKALIEIWRF